ncbi:MAG: serine/threonine-protein kinase [Myxococcota bacterium]
MHPQLEPTVCEPRHALETLDAWMVDGATLAEDTAPNLPEAHPLVGELLKGTYRVDGVIAHGGMASVLSATHIRLRRAVAIKVLAEAYLRSEQRRQRFFAEAEIVAQLDHPHIVSVIDFDFAIGGRPFLVMERLGGDSLAARIHVGPMPPLAVLAVVRQVASALTVAHAAGVVHRDLKPANIMLADTGEPDVFTKLIDFGISRSPGEGRRLTGHRDLLGTPHYMAPEQALSRHDCIGPRTDQYSLGVVAWELLTGDLPFAGHQTVDVLASIVHEPLPRLEERWPHPGASAVEAVLGRAMAKRPEDRFADVAAFAAALELVLNRRPSA